ncbi:MarR family transcriptional regulator [Paenarthrobacter sp. NPDC089322]|uniref:MarR family transcriptional regulator n=1 Tax=Paenarthrobacter sp. NPDC089322 TaxID=3155065 RepID=UPI00341888BB
MRTSRRLRIEATGDVITPGQYTVLAQLAISPQTLRELAEREHVQAPSMTRIVNALTDHGFVSRQAHPGDGRQVQVSITPAGEGVLAEARSQRTAWLAQRVAGLSEEDRLTLSRAAHIMQEMSRK